MSAEQSGWDELPQPRHLADRVLADRVIHAVRRRRRAVVVALVALTLPAALGFVLVMASDGRGPASADHDSGRTVSDRVAIYTAAVADAGAVAEVYVDDPGLSAAERRSLRGVLGSRVHVDGQPAGVRGSSARRVLVLGVLHVRGDRATLPRTVLCGPMCLEGRTVVLVRQGRSWQVTGRSGPDWVS